MNKPKGHSNARTDETEPWSGDTEKAMIPISGGQTVASWRPLPPLALTKEGWQEIGERMGWAKYCLSADVNQTA